PLGRVAPMDGDARRQREALVAVVGAAGDEVAWPQHPGRERTGAAHGNEAVTPRFETDDGLPVPRCEAELGDERHVRREDASAAEVDGLPVHGAGDLEVVGAV